MERIEFDGIGKTLEIELQGKISEFEASGKSHLEALEMLSVEIQAQIEGLVVTYQNTSDWGHFHAALRQTDLYVKQLKWFDQHGYPARIRKQDFDFEDIRRRSKEYGAKAQQIPYLEEVLAEFQAFARWDRYPDKNNFEVKLESEIKALKMEVVFENKPDAKKLVWLRKPSEFGYLFCQLIEGGYIQNPSPLKMSPKRIAELLMEHFHFQQGTTIQTLTKAITTDEANLGDKTFKKLRIPHSDQLEPMKDKKSN